ncbi:hypothetical protein [Helicobacter cinaedi]|uniref:hypothetical protein n=1 Tax=Helicobacter cinaedi TaxID=213 RepID=UPI00034BDB18|nr:hypothetical protein [Helicobacter cinaedi]
MCFKFAIVSPYLFLFVVFWLKSQILRSKATAIISSKLLAFLLESHDFNSKTLPQISCLSLRFKILESLIWRSPTTSLPLESLWIWAYTIT